MKGLRIGRRRARTEQAATPLELALRPALDEGRWQVPDRFNFTRDVVEALAGDPKRQAATILGKDGVIEPRTFFEIAEGAAGRAVTLAEHDVQPKDRVLVMADTSMNWLELVLGIWKAGAVAVPVRPSIAAAALEALHASTGASLVVAEPECAGTIEAMSFAPEVLYVEEGPRKRSSSTLSVGPTHDTSSRDLALVFTSPGTGGASKEIGHTHAAVFATRAQAEQWLDAGRGDVVWCTADSDSPLAIWFTLAGPWSRGAETVIHHGDFDAQERLEHLYRIGPTILCQSAAEFRVLAEHDKLERFRPPRLRRLVSTGDVLEPEVLEVFQESWGLVIHNGYGQAETNILAGDGRDAPLKAGALGRALTGYEIAVVDDQGNELPTGIEGDLAVRGHPPTLFSGYWDAPDETRRAFRGDLYLTGDVAVADEDGVLTFVARAEDVITSSGRTFGPYEVEHVLRSHAAIAACAVVGIRDLQRGGHFVRAFVVPAPGTEGSEGLEAELRQFLAQVLPAQQVPREIVFVDELPMVRGRVSRSALRELTPPGRPLWDVVPTSEPELPAGSAPSEAEPPAPAIAESAPVIAEPTPVIADAPTSTTPEPLLVVAPAQPSPVIPPEPVVEVVHEPLPEPIAEVVVEPEVVPEPEPELSVESIAEPEPVAEVVVEPELEVVPEPEPVAEVVVEPELEVEVEVVPEPEPELSAESITEPESVAEVVVEPELEVVPEPEPERKPELRIVPAALPRSTPVAPLDDEQGEAREREAVPEPEVVLEAEPAEPEPLPDFVVLPDAVSVERAAPPPPAEPEPEPEPDLGPLPDYVVDPNRPARAEPEPERQAAQASQTLGDGGYEPGEESGAAAAGLYFPPVTSFPAPRESTEDGARGPAERQAPRRRPAPDPAQSKSKRSQEEPGDETTEGAWMAGLSNRLSAYSLAEEGERSPDAPPDDKASDSGNAS